MNKIVKQDVLEQAVTNLVNLNVAGEGLVVKTENNKKVFSVENPFPGIDNETLQLNNDDLIAVSIDKDTIVYNEDEEWLEVNHEEVFFEDGLKTKEDFDGLHVSAKVDNETIFINSEGELIGAKQAPDIDGKGLKIVDGNLVLAIDEDTIVFNSEEEWIEVPYKGLYASFPAYLKDSEENIEIGVLFDSETIVLNDRHQLCTVIGGGWKKSIGEMVIASEGSEKIRHHRLPDDNADYDLVTINFPDVREWGGSIDCRVISDIEGLESDVVLEWDSDKQVWIGKCGIGDKGKPNIIIIKEDASIVMTGNEFEAAQEIGNCKIIAKEIPREKIYIDSQFIKVDSETIIINSEGELEAVKQFNVGVALEETSERIVNVLVDSETVFVNDDNKLFIKTATDTQLGVVRFDNDTILAKDSEQLFVNFEGFVDRGLDFESGKVGHTNEVYGRTVGRDLTYTQTSFDDHGHITDMTEKDLSVMQPASSSRDGYKGLVPTPRRGDQTKFLTGNGTWESVASSSLFNVVTNEASVPVSPNNSFIRVVAPEDSTKKIIAPIGWTVHTKNPYVEALEIVYCTEYGEDAITVCARSVAGTVDVSIVGYWLTINI